MSSRPADSPAGPSSPRDGMEEDEVPRKDVRAVDTEKLACDRCRYRKIKCDRVHPCAHCIKSKSQCSYASNQKLKEKRQRVLISAVYENRMENISRKIDDLTEMMNRLSQGQLGTITVPQPTRPEPGPETQREATSSRGTIEPSLFSQAVFATDFLQAAVANDPHSQIAGEMTSAIDALSNVIEAQKRHNDICEGSNPFDKPLPPGVSSKNLPLPNLDKVMACLRMAQDHPRIHLPWILELRSIGHFTEYAVRAYSPGQITDAELIIVHFGLYWLFLECSGIVEDEIIKDDYATQALICQENLETVLSNLSFHTPTTLDYVHAMYLSTLYCLQKSKSIAAWAFITKASLLAQALGLHSNIPMGSLHDNERGNILFWAVYRLEKAVSLRLGRASVIRDHDITAPRPTVDDSSPPWYWRIPNLVETASLYGRVFDDIYGPRALSQPSSIRTSRARALAADLRRIMADNQQFFKLRESLAQFMDPKLLNFFKHADRMTSYSLLTGICKSLPSGKSSSCQECLCAARTTLQEHVICMNLAGDEALHCPATDFWVNGALLLSPFIPFNIIFCNIVETSDASDLRCLSQVVESLESTSRIERYAVACSKQLRIFKALYDVAAKYVEVKTKTQDELMPGNTSGLDTGTYPSAEVHGMNAFSSSALALPSVTSLGQGEMGQEQDLMQLNDQVADDFRMEGDLSGIELGDWFYNNYQIMSSGLSRGSRFESGQGTRSVAYLQLLAWSPSKNKST